MSGKGTNGWSKYQMMVLQRLDRQDKDLDSIKKEIQEVREKDMVQLQVEIAMLKVKSGVWGFLAGAIPASVALAIQWLRK